jgi:hypothetical protein
MNEKTQTMVNQQAAHKTPDLGKAALQRMLIQVEQFAQIEETPLTAKEKSYAAEIVMGVIKAVEDRQISWSEVDVKNVIGQVKRYARLGLTMSNAEIYPDIRKNGKTGKYEVNIKKQYQGIEKELIRWCSKKIVRFLDGVICKGDEFETETDFELGLKKVVKHKKNQNINRNDLENITGAYKIAYVEENGKLVQYPVIIDCKRILRAMAASPTAEKPIWKADAQRMVLKTASWCLYQYVLRPFVNVPIELKDDWAKTQDEMNFNTIAEAEVVAQEEIAHNANTGEVLDLPAQQPPKEPVPVKDIDDIPEEEPESDNPF